MKMTIAEFCEKHAVSKAAREWAIAHCKDMDEVWQKAEPDWLVWVATRKGVLTDKELRLFAVWSARQVQHLMTDNRSITALDVTERFANGNATVEELKAARDAAWEATVEAKEAWAAREEGGVIEKEVAKAAWAVTALEATEAAAGGSWEAAGVAVTVALEAAGEAWESWAMARDEAWDTARAAGAQYLRQNCKPNFNS